MKRQLLAAALCFSILFAPAATSLAQVQQARDLAPYVDMTYIALLERAAELAVSPVEAEAARVIFEAEMRQKKDTAEVKQKLAEQKAKALHSELDALNHQASADTDKLAGERKRIHCALIAARQDVITAKLEKHAASVEYDNRQAKLQVLSRWPADAAQIQQRIKDGNSRQRRHGDYDDIGLRKGFSGQEKDISWGQDIVADMKRMGLMPPEVDVEAQRDYDRATARQVAAKERVARIDAELLKDPAKYDSEATLAAKDSYEASVVATTAAQHNLYLANEITAYVRKIAQRIGGNSDLKVPLRVSLIWDDEPNAFALPGGFVFINTGILYGVDEELRRRSGQVREFSADDEAEIAGVLAHEIAHVTERHGHKLMKRLGIMNMVMYAAMMTIMIVAPPASYGAYYLMQYGFSALQLLEMLNLLGVSRTYEAEADQLGVQYSTKTGYDSEGFQRLYDKLATQYGYAHKSSFFATHPAAYERIHDTFSERAYLPKQEHPVITTAEFASAVSMLKELRTSRLEHLQEVGKDAPTLADPVPDCGPASLRCGI